MLSQNYIGGKKTSLKNIIKGVPKHNAGIMKNIYDDFRRKGFFLYEIRKREPYFSLDPQCVKNVKILVINNRCPLCYSYLEDLDHCRVCNKDISELR